MFLSVDPVTAYNTGDWRQFNRYAYAFNNPYKFTDPDGRHPALKLVVDFAIEAGIQYATTGSVDVGLAAKETLKGALNPLKTLERARDLGRVLNRGGNITENAAKGKVGEAATRAKLGDSAAGEQVSFRTSDGTLTRADFLTKDGRVVETKTGTGKLTSGQRKLEADVRSGRAVTPVGKNAEAAGLKPGEPVKLKDYEVDRPT